MGHLDLPPQVCAVDDVARVVLAGDEGDRPAEGEIHPNAHFAIVEVGHLCCGARRLAARNGQAEE